MNFFLSIINLPHFTKSKSFSLLLIVLIALITLGLTSSCTKSQEVPAEFRKESDRFEAKDLLKNNINYTIEISLNATIKIIEEITIKLYKRNPNQFNQSIDYDINDVVHLIRTNQVKAGKKEMIEQLGGFRNEKLLELAMNPRYKNDRILAFVYGLRTMVNQAYGNDDFYIFDQVEPQKIYQLARNFEIAFWRLFNTKDRYGKAIILSISLEKDNLNISYERLAGKLIQVQDLLSEITSKAYGKALTKQWFDISKTFYFII